MPPFQSSSVSRSLNNQDEPHVQLLSFDTGTSQHSIDEAIMRLALEQARIAADKFQEVPIGAVLVRPKQQKSNDDESSTSEERLHFEILAAGHNMVETWKDASAHAEMIVMRQAASSSNVQSWRLTNTTLYCTLEPCVMCCAAIQAFRLDRIVYGAPDKRLGAIETHIRLLEIAKHPYHDTLTACGGVCENECSQILIDFFRARRKETKSQKNKQQQLLSTSNAKETQSTILTPYKKVSKDAIDRMAQNNKDDVISTMPPRKRYWIKKIITKATTCVRVAFQSKQVKN